MAPKRVYFDSHIYDRLITLSSSQDRNDVLRAIRDRLCVVYGSLSSLEELGAVASKDLDKYKPLINCFWECVRFNLLLDRTMLARAEMQKSNKLSVSELCFTKHYITHQIRPATREPYFLSPVTRDVDSQKDQDVKSKNEEFVKLKRDIEEQVLRCYSGPKSQISAERDQWAQSVRPNEIQIMLDNHRKSNGFVSISYQSAPCASAYLGYDLARFKRSLLTNKKYERSASHDRDHFVYSAMLGTLVTDDQDFVRTVRFIESSFVDVLNTNEFLCWIRART